MRLISRILAALLLLLLCALGAFAQSSPDAAAKGFFSAVATKSYANAWHLMSAQSQNWLIGIIAKQAQVEPAQIKVLFDVNDPKLQDGFWEEFRKSSKSEDLVKLGTFETVEATETDAKVNMTINGSTKTLLMKNEGGWKLGYQETFLPSGQLP
ncbi:unnamed protein product [Phaeothamnion confervicola]